MSCFKRVLDRTARTSPNDFTTFWHVKKKNWGGVGGRQWALPSCTGLWGQKLGEKLRFHHLQTGFWPTSDSLSLQLLGGGDSKFAPHTCKWLERVNFSPCLKVMHLRGGVGDRPRLTMLWVSPSTRKPCTQKEQAGGGGGGVTNGPQMERCRRRKVQRLWRADLLRVLPNTELDQSSGQAWAPESRDSSYRDTNQSEQLKGAELGDAGILQPSVLIHRWGRSEPKMSSCTAAKSCWWLTRTPHPGETPN